MQETAEAFWGDLAGDYNDIIRRLVTLYPTMVKTLFNYLPPDFTPHRILELGCGTGNFTAALRKRWPDAEIIAVDAAAAMLEKTKARLGSENFQFVESKFENLTFDKHSFDYIGSSLSLHHLSAQPLKNLLKACNNWLVPDGMFGLIDCVRAKSDRLYQRTHELWIEQAKEHGVTDQEMQDQIDHHLAHDHYPVLIDLANWLRDAKYQEVDILWRNCIWAVLQGRKKQEVNQ